MIKTLFNASLFIHVLNLFFATQCNGNGTGPCKECHEAGAECLYLTTPRISKADLRKELARLQSLNEESDTLLGAISSQDTGPEELREILRRLSDGQSRAQVAAMLAQKANDSPSRGIARHPSRANVEARRFIACLKLSPRL